MSDSASQTSPIERFCTRSQTVGVDVTRVSRADVSSTLADLCDREPSVVGAPLPWTDVSLPDSATTMPTPAELEAASTGITAAVSGIADYGSILLRSTADGVEPVSLFPDRHVAVLHEADVVPDMATAIGEQGEAFREEGASMIVATGPSATADMGELVTGAHGPKEVHVVLFGGEDR
ncbi:LUD domain-containing protein [Halobacteria archaeon AArc-m2/3/4]|uniref:LUD domain-containing protein n=1 Tax=Natronoglomus mannanivorans TaxID=2979990 RepID=A0AAP3E2N5_9EURY|nr:LUD domain-containing protein [Halobacteria archaeon AArc-xg1-1]MCU4975311.1 LUD domain-containing protein [Halobacteria archaeon AArc-m2/3/4]